MVMGVRAQPSCKARACRFVSLVDGTRTAPREVDSAICGDAVDLTAYRCLASGFAHLGRDAEAREAATRLLEIDPASTISGWIARGGQSNSKVLIEGLRKAGLPE